MLLNGYGDSTRIASQADTCCVDGTPGNRSRLHFVTSARQPASIYRKDMAVNIIAGRPSACQLHDVLPSTLR